MGRRLSRLCPPYATPSSNSSLHYRRSDARIVENGFATSGGLSKSAKVVLASSLLTPSCWARARAFHVPHRHMDTPDGETIVDHLAGVEDYTLAMATYRAAIKRWSNTPITLRQGARVIEDSRCLRLAETNKSRQSGR